MSDISVPGITVTGLVFRMVRVVSVHIELPEWCLVEEGEGGEGGGERGGEGVLEEGRQDGGQRRRRRELQNEVGWFCGW